MRELMGSSFGTPPALEQLPTPMPYTELSPARFRDFWKD
jgi:hypothetical protein